METHLHNGLFRVYWTEDDEVESFKDTGLGLRYEWYYKDGKKQMECLKVGGEM